MSIMATVEVIRVGDSEFHIIDSLYNQMDMDYSEAWLVRQFRALNIA